MKEKGNVLVIGNSGAGKSTLINAVLGEHIAAVKTEELEIRESEPNSEKQVPFRMIDTIGFEPSRSRTKRAVQAVKKWCEQNAKDGDEHSQIDILSIVFSNLPRNAGVFSILEAPILAFSLIFSLTRRNEGNFFMRRPRSDRAALRKSVWPPLWRGHKCSS